MYNVDFLLRVEIKVVNKTHVYFEKMGVVNGSLVSDYTSENELVITEVIALVSQTYRKRY